MSMFARESTAQSASDVTTRFRVRIAQKWLTPHSASSLLPPGPSQANSDVSPARILNGLGLATATTSASILPQFEQRIRTVSRHAQR
jgi:hypothetical protein